MFSQDIPITKTEDDLLSRVSFAGNLAKVLCQCSFSSSFTIGLYGEWGSGKTSLLNMIFEIVETLDDSIIVIKFNPWLCSDTKQLITQFFKQMAAAIKLKASNAEQVWKLIDRYADILDAVNLIPVAGSFLAAFGKTLKARARAKIDRQTFDLQENKDKITKKIVEAGLKIIVSVDDIDRLSEEEIIAVFQLVKALADFPNTVYLLAFDYDVVVRALGKIQHGDGREYLEKVIQVPFEIPAPSMKSIQDAFFSKLGVILGEIPESNWDRAAWAELFQFGIREYIKSIRDVVRYTNVFSLKYGLLKDETDPVDLLGLTCLQVFEPAIYSRLPRYKDTLCGTNGEDFYEGQKDKEEKAQKEMRELILSGGAAANEKAAKEILGILFPRAKSVLGVPYATGRYFVYRNFLINNNISVPACFDRYFSLTLEDDAVPTATVKRLIYEADESGLREGIQEIYREGKVIWLLEQVEAYADKNSYTVIPPERADLLIRCLARQWGSFRVDDGGFLTIPFNWRLLFCVDALLEAMDASRRYSCLRAVFEDKEVQPSTLGLLLQDLEMQHGRFTERKPVEDERILTLDQVLELEQIFKERAVEALDSGTALKQYKGLSFLGMLEQLDADLAAKKKKNIVSDDLSLVKVIEYCIMHGEAAGRTITKTWNINPGSVAEFIDEEEACRRIRNFVKTEEFFSLPEEEQMDVAAFLVAEERKPEEGTMDHCIDEEAVRKELEKILR